MSNRAATHCAALGDFSSGLTKARWLLGSLVYLAVVLDACSIVHRPLAAKRVGCLALKSIPVEAASGDSVALLTADFRRAEPNAANELVEQFHAELRRLAAARMKGERLDHTWQTTALVNELYIELVKVRQLTSANLTNQEDKAAFLGFAGNLMKRLLIHHARPLYRRVERVSFEDGREPVAEGTEALQDVDDALSRLATINPKFRCVVEMRVFEGLRSDEIASKLNCSRRTVASYWNFARRWLEKEWAGGVFRDG